VIRKITLNSGRTPEAKGEIISPTPLVVFVGPNNSGKSRLLQELLRACVQPNIADQLIVGEVEFEPTTGSRAEALIQNVTLPHQPHEVPAGHTIVGKRGVRRQLAKRELLAALADPALARHQFVEMYLSYNTVMLDGASRLAMVNDQEAGALHQTPQTSFQVLFRDDGRRSELRQIIFDAFGEHLVIDPTQQVGRLHLRLSKTAPRSPEVERGLHDEAIAFHAAATPLQLASDGVRAFTGIILQLIADDPKIILIDEPEAFLHPALTFKLAQHIASMARKETKQVYVATHSADFVMGCVQSGIPVTIVRVTYREGHATARVLNNIELLDLMRNPLLRSSGVLSGLFYEHVIVTESDSDRAFYQEVNERLRRESPARGVPNCLFINAQNKQTIQTIVKPLRHLGIPAAAIVDIDVLKEGGTVWASLLAAAAVPVLEQNSLAVLRASIKAAMDASGKNMKRDGGLAILNKSDAEAATNLLGQLGQYGLFVVPHGELESWLKTLGAEGHGPAWLIDIFQRMGDEPHEAAYVRPEKDDVWSFIDRVGVWLVDRSKRGIPD